MKTYLLTLTWPSGHTITVYKDFDIHFNAVTWQTLCEDICGKDENGIRFSDSTLTVVSKPLHQNFNQHRVARADADRQQAAFADALDAITADLHKCFKHGFTHYPEDWKDGHCLYGPAVTIKNPKITNLTLSCITDRDHLSTFQDFEVCLRVDFEQPTP